MAFEELRERLSSEFKNQWEQFQESTLYIQARDRYENLTPPKQKAVLIGAVLFVGYMILSVPLSYFSTSSEYLAEFQDKRQLVRDLLKVSREVQDIPDIPVPPDVGALKSQIDSQIQAAQLLPEQIKGTEISSERIDIIPGSLIQGMVKVTLSQLNLRQIVDLGYQFQAISPSVKMTDLQMEANQKDPRYYDVIYRLAVLAVPSQTEEAPEPEPPARRRGN